MNDIYAIEVAQEALNKLIEKEPELKLRYEVVSHIGLAVWQACAESNQSELDKANKEVEHYLSAYRIAHKQAMDNGQARDKANARIAQLENDIRDIKRLAVMVSDVNIASICNDAFKIASDTWLSQHDKAVEIKLLEEIAKMLFIIDLPYISQKLFQMAESRK